MRMLLPRTTTLQRIFRSLPLISNAFSKARFMKTSTPITMPSIQRPPLSFILSFFATYLFRSGEQPCFGSGLLTALCLPAILQQIDSQKDNKHGCQNLQSFINSFFIFDFRRLYIEKYKSTATGRADYINLMQLQNQERLSLLPKRLKGSYTNKFRSLNITTNHFHVEVENFEEIHIFSLLFTPKIPYDNTSLRREVLETGMESIKMYIDNPVISGNNIYSTRPSRSQLFEIEAKGYKVGVKQVKVLKVKENPKLLLSFLNNGLRSIMRKLNYIEIGRSGKYFNASEKTNIDNLMMFSGYRSNFVLLENGFYLRVDSAKKIVRNQTVLQVIDEVYKFHQDKQKDEKRLILQNELQGKIIMTNYGRTSYHKIEEVVFQDLESIQLEDASMSLREYYVNKYNIQIKNPKQPLLRVESKRKGNKQFQIYLVPQLCLMTGIPDNFDEFRRKKISENTIKSADEKQREILKLMRQLRDNDEFQSFKQIGIRINKNLETIKGKLIPMPKINLGQNNSIQEGKQAFFNLFNKPIFSSKHSIRCGVIYFSGQDTRGLLETFESTSRNLRVKLDIVKLNAGDFDFRRALGQIQTMLKRAVEKDQCNICLIILPNPLKTQYKKVKAEALLHHKIICQITTEATLKKKNLQSIATKILLQIIAKRGNTLWVPRIPSGMPLTMMIAFETVKDRQSTLGMCATINSTFSSIFSRTQTFDKAEQKFNVMVNLSLQAASAYLSRNKQPPAEIIIFHSSTSGDQIPMFQQFYINIFKARLSEIYKEKTPAISMVMVNVKTSERFFTEGDNARNVPAGTLVATDIVTNYYDFYVVSQASNRGSTVPNHYRVIYSDSKMEEGMLQELVFSQCFNYVNWTGSIKVPGILQYAGKCAKFNSEILENEMLCDDLQGKLYFV